MRFDSSGMKRFEGKGDRGRVRPRHNVTRASWPVGFGCRQTLPEI